jgi:hypothetical protein
MLAEMEVATRRITVVNVDGTERSIQLQECEDESDPPPPGKAHLKKWWTPILQMQFDDGLCRLQHPAGFLCLEVSMIFSYNPFLTEVFSSPPLIVIPEFLDDSRKALQAQPCGAGDIPQSRIIIAALD